VGAVTDGVDDGVGAGAETDGADDGIGVRAEIHGAARRHIVHLALGSHCWSNEADSSGTRSHA